MPGWLSGPRKPRPQPLGSSWATQPQGLLGCGFCGPGGRRWRGTVLGVGCASSTVFSAVTTEQGEGAESARGRSHAELRRVCPWGRHSREVLQAWGVRGGGLSMAA